MTSRNLSPAGLRLNATREIGRALCELADGSDTTFGGYYRADCLADAEASLGRALAAIATLRALAAAAGDAERKAGAA